MAEIHDGLAGHGEITGFFYTPTGLGGRFWPFSPIFSGFALRRSLASEPFRRLSGKLGRTTALLGRTTALLGRTTGILGRAAEILGQATGLLGRTNKKLGGVSEQLRQPNSRHFRDRPSSCQPMTRTEKLLAELIALPSVNPAFLPPRHPHAGEKACRGFSGRHRRARRTGS